MATTTDRPITAATGDGIRACTQRLVDAWTDYRATGLHVTAAEADAWLEALAQGNDVEPPKCHT